MLVERLQEGSVNYTADVPYLETNGEKDFSVNDSKQQLLILTLAKCFPKTLNDQRL